MIGNNWKRYAFIWMIFFTVTLQAQSLQLEPFFGKEKLQNGRQYTVAADSISVTVLRFYLSNIELREAGKTIWKEENSYHLIDIMNEESWKVPLAVPAKSSYDQLFFTVGIDSLTNVSGALGGDLDPTKGMYWAWQSGYINFKIEGNCRHCASPGEYEFHLGGYLAPYASAVEVALPFTKSNPKIFINLKPFFETINFSQTQHVMSPGKNAVMLSKKIKDCFSSTAP